MGKRKTNEALAGMIETALRPGDFISYGRSWDFVRSLEETKGRLDGLLAAGEADQAVALYEIFLAGCYEKAGEIDDSGGNLGLFFQDLFCCWIKARQAAGRDPAETVREILKWMDHDEYGFCFDTEAGIALALNKAGFGLFKKQIEDRFDAAFAPFAGEEAQFIYDYPSAVYMTARRLKAIYVARGDVRSYSGLCERIVASPKDCEKIAHLYKAKGRPEPAMVWVERGLAIGNTRRWGNEDSYSLEGLKRELLSKVGRKGDALQSAWSEFTKRPSAFAYEEPMRYVSPKGRREWHGKAMAAAKDAELAEFIDLCVEARELDQLAGRIDTAAPAELESISHYVTEKAAAALERRHGVAAAKVHCAMAMRVLGAGKSKYYPQALEHLQAARDLYTKHKQEQVWQAVVERVRRDHSRKHSLVPSFEGIVAGDGPPDVESFEARARGRWRKQTSP
jgi:hypothetical protein